MARRAPSAATDDSQKENSGIRSQRNANLLKIKPEKASINTGPSRDEEHDNELDNADLEGDDAVGTEGHEERDENAVEDEGEREEEDDQGGSPRGRKRARANSLGESYPSGSQRINAKMEKKIFTRDVDGYIPGSIVRVRLENFVTYDWVEFTPGPYLNMILGPNGTGKSSIACALCLGLNFPPSLLGRASDIQGFVKMGKKTGFVELELKSPPGKPNLVIRRNLNANSKSSQYLINGKSASGRDVNQRIQELNIQVSNLCSFLPQDRVAEFARMTPQQLLRETQRAAGDSRLTSWHDALINNGKDHRKLLEELAGDRQQLQTAEERNATLEREVKLYNERRNMELEIEFLELLLPFQQYKDAMKHYSEAKARRKEVGIRVKQVQQKHAPITKLKTQLERQHNAVDEQREAKKKMAREKYTAMQKHWARNEDLETKAEDHKRRLDSLKREERNRLKNIERLERDLVSWQKEWDNPPPVENIHDVEAAKRANAEKSRNIRERQEELQDRQRTVINEEVMLNQRLGHASQRLHDLNSVDHRKLENLQKWDRDCADTVMWLRNNKSRFRMEIFEPPVLSVTVQDKRFASAVEACFSANDLKTFVAQCEEDYQTLNRLIADTPEGLGRKARINTWFRRQAAVHDPPVDKQELRSLGFDGYAMDFVQYPPGMDWFLQDALSLHRTALAVSNPNSVNTDQATNILGRQGGVRYIVGNVMNHVSRSRYGQRLAQNATRNIGQARQFSVPTVDPDVKRRIEQDINEAQSLLQDSKKAQEGLAEEERKLKDEHSTLRQESNAIQARKQAILDVERRKVALKAQLESGRERLEKLRTAPSAEQERERLKEQIVQTTVQRAHIISSYEKLLRQAIECQVAATKSGLEYLQITAKRAALENISKAQEDEYKKVMEEFDNVNADYQFSKRDSKEKLDISRAKLDAAPEEIRAKFQQAEEGGELEAEDKNVDAITIELETKKAQLAMNMHTNAGVVDTYQRRQAEIATLSQKIENTEERVQRLEGNIRQLRDQWEPELTRLVESIGEKFSAAFDRIGCAGQINITQHEDFEKWAIEILVKFRDAERLQPLTAERQSGGERSLTTILYLMSLTEHARAPFSLVDEINQGMDKRAERAVHDSLVEVTCKADSGQYFLITPKLLPDLTYHERMKILCVNNGEWLPDAHMTGNMMNMIDAYLGARGHQGQ